MYGHRKDNASETAAASFTTEPIYSTFHVPNAQIAILETASSSSENPKQPLTMKQSVTPHVYSLASHVVSSITVLPGTIRLNSSIQPSRAVLYSRNFTAIFLSNSTSLSHGSENSAIDDCSAGNVGEKSCDTYVTRWVDFYLNVSITQCVYVWQLYSSTPELFISRVFSYLKALDVVLKAILDLQAKQERSE